MIGIEFESKPIQARPILKGVNSSQIKLEYNYNIEMNSNLIQFASKKTSFWYIFIKNNIILAILNEFVYACESG